MDVIWKAAVLLWSSFTIPQGSRRIRDAYQVQHWISFRRRLHPYAASPRLRKATALDLFDSTTKQHRYIT